MEVTGLLSAHLLNKRSVKQLRANTSKVQEPLFSVSCMGQEYSMMVLSLVSSFCISLLCDQIKCVQQQHMLFNPGINLGKLSCAYKHWIWPSLDIIVKEEKHAW